LAISFQDDNTVDSSGMFISSLKRDLIVVPNRSADLLSAESRIVGACHLVGKGAGFADPR
jgi:hypothetical protein